MKKAFYYILMLVLLCAMVGCDGGSEEGEGKEPTPTIAETQNTPTPENTPIAEATPGVTQGTKAPTPTVSEQTPNVTGTLEDDVILYPTEAVPTEGVGDNPTEAPTKEPTAIPTETPVATPTTGVIDLPFVPF